MGKNTFSLNENNLFVYLNDIGYYDFNELKFFNNVENIDTIENNTLRCLYYTGLGKSATVEGDLLSANSSFKSAFQIVDDFPEEITGDTLAFILYEYSIFNRLMKNESKQLALLKRGQNLAKSPTLKLYYKYSIALATSKTDLTQLINIVKEIKKQELLKTYIMGQNQIGLKFSSLKEYETAAEYYERARRLANQNKIPVVIQQIKNSVGYLRVQRGDYESAIDYLTKEIPNTESHYTRILMTENIALAMKGLGDIKGAIAQCEKAYDMAQAHHVVCQLPDQCMFIARGYEELEQPEQAHIHYKQGYDIAMDHYNRGLGLFGPRKEAVESYTAFMDKYSTLKTIHLRERLAFEYSMGKKWQESQAIFHYHLAMLHLSQSSNMDTFYARTDMLPTTFYAIKNRLKRYGHMLPSIKAKDILIAPEVRVGHLVLYIEKYLMDNTWKDANQIYENDFFLYLFKKHRYNRVSIAESLQVTYPTVYHKVADAIEAEEW